MSENFVRQAVTHSGTFELISERRGAKDRIFSGMPSPVVLTIRLTSLSVDGVVEVWADGHLIPDGSIETRVFKSRTFRIEKANIIDLKLPKPKTAVRGVYIISVLI